MPPETLTIAGRRFPKTMVYAGGALTAGIVGYAWWTRRTDDDTVVEDTYLEDSYGDERIPPTTIDSSQVAVDTRAGLKTDQEWFNAALDKLLFDYGVADTATASDALTRYLARQDLSSAQIKMIQFVINSLGPPPVSGTLPLKQTPAVPKPPTPTTPKTTMHRIGRVGQNYSFRDQARRFAQQYWNTSDPNTVESMLRRLVDLNPTLRGRTTIPGGFPLIVPTTK